jgi:long-chain acyl-CoA synthetase
MTEPIAQPGPDVVGDGMQIAYWAEVLPDHLAIVDRDRTITYAELNVRCNQLVRALRGAGLRAGDTVAIMSRNCLEWGVVLGACSRAGFRYVPMNWHLGSDEVGYILGDCEAKAVFHDVESTDVIAEARERATGVELAICVDPDPNSGRRAFDELIEGHDGSDIDDPVFGTRMVYTSGTTGHPKGVFRSPEAQRTRAVTVAAEGRFAVNVHYEAGVHRHLANGPFYHSGPGAQSLVIPLNAGVTVVMMRKWDTTEFLRLSEQHRITHTHVAPIIFQRLLQLPAEERERYDLSSYVQMRHGGAPCAVPVKQAMIDWLGPVIDEYYGATEGSATSVDAATWLEHPGTVGRVQPRDHIKILDADGRELPDGDVGTIWVRSASPFEYLGAKEKTAESIRDGYFTVNDVGYKSPDGFLYLTDRSVDLIISGGANIYSAEVEAVLSEHPAVRDAAVVGVPNEEWGEEVWAGIELEDPDADRELVEKELRELCHDKIARFKCPRVFRWEEQLPREESGKLFKRKLRDQYRAMVDVAHSANPAR